MSISREELNKLTLPKFIVSPNILVWEPNMFHRYRLELDTETNYSALYYKARGQLEFCAGIYPILSEAIQAAERHFNKQNKNTIN